MLERIWISGYRAYELSVFGDQDPKLTVIKYSLKNALLPMLDAGLQWVITGGQLGVEQWAAEVALLLKADYPALQVAMMVPYADFGQQWNEANQAKLAKLKTSVDFFAATSSTPYQSPSQLSGYNRFMSQHTDGALFLYDDEFPGKAEFGYRQALAEGQRREYSVSTIGMDDLQDAARELQDDQD